MKFHSSSHQYNFTWEQVAGSFFERYPNPQSSHVLTEDVLSRHVGSDGCLYTKRLFTKTNKLPRWGAPFVGSLRNTHCIEESVVDPKAKSIVTYTRNVGVLTKVMSVDEKCVYRPSPDSPDTTTECQKEAWISSPVGLSRFGFNRMIRNMCQASEGFEYVLGNHYGVPATALPETEPDTGEQKRRATVLTSSGMHKLKATAEKAKEGAEKTKEAAKNKATTAISSSIN